MNSIPNPAMNEAAYMPSEERQAQALYAYLHGALPQDAADVPADEAALGQALRALADQTHPDEKFDAGLQKILRAEANRIGVKVNITNVGRALGWAVALFILIIGLGWAIRTVLPQPAAVETAELTSTATQEGPGAATATPAQSLLPTVTPPDCAILNHTVSEGETLMSIAYKYGVAPETILSTNGMTEPVIFVGQVLVIPICQSDALPTSTPEAEPLQVYTSPQMPDLEIVIQAQFPDAPAEMAVYEHIPWPALTIDAARQVASQLGLPGAAYKPAYHNPLDIATYIFTDGFKRINFTNNVYQFYYEADSSAAMSGDIPLPLTVEQIAEIEAYIKERGLLEFPYQVEDTAFSGQITGVATFIQLLDGFPLRFSGFYGPRLSILTDSRGQVKTIDGSRVNFKSLGSYSILSAEKAWQKVIAADMPPGVELNTTKPISIPARWQRTYPMGQTVDVYGSAEILQPAEPGGAAQIFLEGAPLRGNIDGIAQLSEEQQFIQATGQYQPGETGARVFVVESWQVSPLPLNTIIGVVERKDGQVTLQTTDRSLRLLNVPDALLNGAQIMVSGVVLEGVEPVLAWNWIYSQPFGSGGGGGGISFLDLNLSDTPVPTPTPYPLPTVEAGRRLEGVVGNPTVIIRQYEDGSRRLEVDFYIAPNDDFPDGLSLRLAGAAVEGLEVYHMLPVRIWGTLSGKTAGWIIYLDLERYEPVYPGVKMQAWMGQIEAVTLESKKVARFTAQDGQQYIINSSLLDENRIEWMPLDQTVIIEGAVYPDQTFAGYPVLQDVQMSPAGGLQNLSQYQMQYAIPRVIQESGSASLPRRVVIEKIELVYHTMSLPGPGEESLGIVYIQPMWRFIGHYPDGTLFEFLVQALLDQYLKPWE